MIFILTGRSGSGKTSLAIEIAKRTGFKRLVSHTTRPMREGEKNGVEYHFITNEQLEDVELICKNTFDTVHGLWTYGLNVDGLDMSKHYIGILEAAGSIEIKEKLGDQVKIIYLNVAERTCKKRAYARENKKKDPEIERRFKADAIDFKDFAQKADYSVKNSNIEIALKALERIIIKHTKASKYKATKIEINNIKFDSKLEADYYLKLLEDVEAGTVKKFEIQVPYELLPAFVINEKKRLPIKYKADFVVTYADDSEQVIDIKGFETADFKIKKKIFEHKFNKELICLAYSKIDGGWIELEQLKANRKKRKKTKKK